MPEINWEAITEFERFPKLDSMKVGDSIEAKFTDNGVFVSADQLREAHSKFPRDSYVFVLEVKGEKREFWMSQKAYSLVRVIKKIRDANGGNLKGVKVKIKRISSSTVETNYEFV
jgi:hypothetical protein